MIRYYYKQNKKYIEIVGIIIFFFIIAFVIFKCGFNRDGEDDCNITVKNGIVTEETVDVYLSGFYPTKKEEYDIMVNSNTNGDFNFTLMFEELGDGTLQEYIEVKIIVDDTEKDADMLKSYLDGKKATFSHEISKNSPTKISIIYTMPESVGNEAKLAKTDFNLIIRIDQ